MSGLKQLIHRINDLSGDEMIQEVFRYFGESGRLHEVSGIRSDDFGPKNWPNSPGVYVVIHKVDEEILYVGMTGKIRCGGLAGIEMRGGRLSQRAGRWTPYTFQKFGMYKDNWECGPNFDNSGGRPPPVSESNYSNHFPLKDITVRCIDLSGIWKDISPSFLEALFLQAFISMNDRLPLANQEF